jgi:hypothetical protein
MAGLVDVPDTSFQSGVAVATLNIPGSARGGRLMSDMPHIDGVESWDAGQLDKDSANLVLTRNAKGDWSLNRTAAGAETYNCRVNISENVLRLGEIYNLGVGPQGAKYPKPPNKGILVTDIFAIYTVGVVNLTTATLRLGKSVFANNVALAQTDVQAATGIATVVQANPYVQTVAVPAGSQLWAIDDTSQWEIEVQFVMANTGTLRVYGIGCHISFNWN